jgi:hypothetical protein
LQHLNGAAATGHCGGNALLQARRGRRSVRSRRRRRRRRRRDGVCLVVCLVVCLFVCSFVCSRALLGLIGMRDSRLPVSDRAPVCPPASWSRSGRLAGRHLAGRDAGLVEHVHRHVHRRARPKPPPRCAALASHRDRNALRRPTCAALEGAAGARVVSLAPVARAFRRLRWFVCLRVGVFCALCFGRARVMLSAPRLRSGGDAEEARRDRVVVVPVQRRRVPIVPTRARHAKQLELRAPRPGALRSGSEAERWEP